MEKSNALPFELKITGLLRNYDEKDLAILTKMLSNVISNFEKKLSNKFSDKLVISDTSILVGKNSDPNPIIYPYYPPYYPYYPTTVTYSSMKSSTQSSNVGGIVKDIYTFTT